MFFYLKVYFYGYAHVHVIHICDLIHLDRLSGVVREHADVGYLYCDGNGKGHTNSPTMQSLSNLSHEDYVHEQSGGSSCQEITDIPDDYLSQSQV